MLQAMFREKKSFLINNSAPDSIKTTKGKRKTIRIGWTGAPWTRPKDLNELKAISQLAKEGYKNVQLVHVGHDPKALAWRKY